jgi:hypothetical protein
VRTIDVYGGRAQAMAEAGEEDSDSAGGSPRGAGKQRASSASGANERLVRLLEGAKRFRSTGNSNWHSASGRRWRLRLP